MNSIEKRVGYLTAPDGTLTLVWFRRIEKQHSPGFMLTTWDMDVPLSKTEYKEFIDRLLKGV